MIPRTAIHFNPDGTAWLVTHECDCDHRLSVGCHLTYRNLDDECRPCGGDSNLWFRLGGSPCPDCDGTGRHTFTVDVAWQTEVDAYESETHRVSVVPGMVLPIVRGACPTPTNAEHRPAHIHVNTDESPMPVFGMCEADSDLIFGSPWKSENLLTLPLDAKPGGYAVKVLVHR
jgi:hypothetical protein